MAKTFGRLQERFRKERFKIINAMIRDILNRKGTATILDAGGRPEYWRMLDEDLRPRTQITCMNFESELKRYSRHPSDLAIFSVAGDACSMPQYENGQFDLVHSNSVIEHVGSLGNMVRFAEEVRRVANAYYVQTPNFWFPIEPHYAVPFIHWLPDQARLWVFTSMSLGLSRKTDLAGAIRKIDHTRMIGPRLLKALFPDGRMVSERLAFLAKSHTMIRDFDPQRSHPTA